VQKLFEAGHIKPHADSGKFYNTTFRIFRVRGGFTRTPKSASSIHCGVCVLHANTVMWLCATPGAYIAVEPVTSL